MALGFSEPALGIAIKIVDGSQRALGALAVETCKQLGLIGDMADYPTIARHQRPAVLNARRLKTGEIRAEFQLLRH